MKKIYIGLFAICIIFLFIICTRIYKGSVKEMQTDLSTIDRTKRTEQTVTSDNNSETKDYPMVIDETGKKWELKLGKINVGDSSEYFLTSTPTAVYSQISDGHYYYMRSNGKGKYTIYRDKGEKIGKFLIEEFSGAISYFLKYGEDFYGVYDIDEYDEDEENFDEEESDKVQLIKIDLEKSSYTVLPGVGEINIDEFGAMLDRRMYFYFYRDSCFFDTGHDTSSTDLLKDAPMKYFPGKLMRIDQRGNKTEVQTTPNMDKAKPCLTFIDGKIYYGDQTGKTVNLYSYDIEKGIERKIFCYNRNDQSSILGYSPLDDKINLSIDNDYIYCQDYIIPRKGGEMIPLFRDAMLYDDDTISFSSNSKYIYYIDKNYKVRRFDKRTKQLITVTKKQMMDVKCTEKGVYAQREKLMPGDWWDPHDTDDPTSCDLYYMDLDGKNIRKIAD